MKCEQKNGLDRYIISSDPRSVYSKISDTPRVSSYVGSHTAHNYASAFRPLAIGYSQVSVSYSTKYSMQ